MESCAEFKITEPGFYRTLGGEKVEVVAKNRHSVHYPWIVIRIYSGNIYTVTDSGQKFNAEKTERDIVAKWEEPVEKFERVDLYRDGIGYLRFEDERGFFAVTVALSRRGFAGYIYEHEGHTSISSLPCGWPIWENAGTEAAYLVIAAEPSNDDDMLIFPVAWRRLNVDHKEGGE